MSSGAPQPTPRLRDSYRALPRTAWILFAGTFVLRLGSFVFPFLALYLTRTGLSVTEAGLAITGYGVGAMLAQFSGGLLGGTAIYGWWPRGLWIVCAALGLLGAALALAAQRYPAPTAPAPRAS